MKKPQLNGSIFISFDIKQKKESYNGMTPSKTTKSSITGIHMDKSNV
jgi:hypothetical protein